MKIYYDYFKKDLSKVTTAKKHMIGYPVAQIKRTEVLRCDLKLFKPNI